MHSYYTELKTALDEAGFENGNKDHLLVSCGDLFDRGDESQELLNYINSIDNKILIQGNHDQLAYEMITRGYPQSHDKHNKTDKTIWDLSGLTERNPNNFQFACELAWEKLKPLYTQSVNYFETEHYIFVHGWIPLKYPNNELAQGSYYYGDDNGDGMIYDSNWREVHNWEWDFARWYSGFYQSEQGTNQTGKIIVCGHIGTAQAHYREKSKNADPVTKLKMMESYDDYVWGNKANNDIYYGDDIIGIDATTPLSGKVNVLVIEDDLLEENYGK